MMTRKTSTCAVCEKSSLASICVTCVNNRLNECRTTLNSLKNRRDSLGLRLREMLVAKSEADDQLTWRVLQNEKHARLREKLDHRRGQCLGGKAMIEKMSRDLKVKFEWLKSAMSTLEKNRLDQLEKFYPDLIRRQNLGLMAITSERHHRQSVIIKQICKVFPLRQVNVDGERKDRASGQYDQICHACLPRGLDPHSIPSEELSTSLGYMVQLLNLVVHNVAAPSLHNAGFAGSCSWIWQRDSYWNARPSSRSNEYPLFIPPQNNCSTCGETSWLTGSSSNFGVASMESQRNACLDSSGSSFVYCSAPLHSVETHQDLQKGISLLRKSVACVTAYCYNALCLDVPADGSTFEAFANLLGMLSSSREVRSNSRSLELAQPLNKPTGSGNTYNINLPNASSFYTTESFVIGKNENIIEGWDLVEHPTFPPPPSQTEDVEHWTQALIIDATKKS